MPHNHPKRNFQAKLKKQVEKAGEKPQERLAAILEQVKNLETEIRER